MRPSKHFTMRVLVASAVASIMLPILAIAQAGTADAARPAPGSEPVQVSELPLPPTAPSTAVGSCSLAVNPHDTGCIGAADTDVQEGPSYVWDGRDVLLNINFAGAPAAPDPGNSYSGSQVIMIRTDGTTFPDGDSLAVHYLWRAGCQRARDEWDLSITHRHSTTIWRCWPERTSSPVRPTCSRMRRVRQVRFTFTPSSGQIRPIPRHSLATCGNFD